MNSETRRYRWLRLAVLGSGSTMLASLIVLSVLQMRNIWPFIRGAELECGCQLVPVGLGTSQWILTGVVAGLTLLFLGRFVTALIRGVARQRRRQRELRANGRWQHHRDLDRAYWLYTDDTPAAASIGYWRPTVMVSEGLLRRLSGSEFAAVLRHEQAHCRRRDPLWALLLESVGAAWHWLPWLRDWVKASYSYREMAADADATGNYARTVPITGAILKLAAPMEAGVEAAFSPNTDRVEKLIDPSWRPRHRLWRWRYGFGLGLIVAAFFTLANLTTSVAAELPRMEAGICARQTYMCAQPDELHMTVVCLERFGWQCLPLRSSQPLSSYGFMVVPR